ncbi:hypothetical protein H1P_110057 [Hyella patelloides LEGE 07179]|uniref:Uncharacterized protein n=1 Tax=Hyella patelloides LEGE 07179 TaxID=945734 RepID=A0A563VJV0_9CYAN|nr:hypothetical protein H1P_110057 [Hyella patelloides LEGE 07179]
MIIWKREHPPEAIARYDDSQLLDYKDESAILANFKS